MARQPVDFTQVCVDLQRCDTAFQRHVPVPPVGPQHSERDPRIAAEVIEPRASLVEIDEHAPVLPQIPGGHCVGTTITA